MPVLPQPRAIHLVGRRISRCPTPAGCWTTATCSSPASGSRGGAGTSHMPACPWRPRRRAPTGQRPGPGRSWAKARFISPASIFLRPGQARARSAGRPAAAAQRLPSPSSFAALPRLWSATSGGASPEGRTPSACGWRSPCGLSAQVRVRPPRPAAGQRTDASPESDCRSTTYLAFPPPSSVGHGQTVLAFYLFYVAVIGPASRARARCSSATSSGGRVALRQRVHAVGWWTRPRRRVGAAATGSWRTSDPAAGPPSAARRRICCPSPGHPLLPGKPMALDITRPAATPSCRHARVEIPMGWPASLASLRHGGTGEARKRRSHGTATALATDYTDLHGYGKTTSQGEELLRLSRCRPVYICVIMAVLRPLAPPDDVAQGDVPGGAAGEGALDADEDEDRAGYQPPEARAQATGHQRGE